MPDRASRYPTPLGPASSIWMAMITLKTVRAPNSRPWVAASSAVVRRSRSLTITPIPATVSRHKPRSASGSSSSGSPTFSRVGSRTPSTRTSDHRNVTTFSQKAIVTPKSPTSVAPSAGPTKTTTFSRLDATALLDVSSSGLRASFGTRPAWAARKGAPTMTARTPSV